MMEAQRVQQVPWTRRQAGKCEHRLFVQRSGLLRPSIGWNTTNSAPTNLNRQITDMKFEMPRQPGEHYKRLFVPMHDEVVNVFRSIAEDK